MRAEIVQFQPSFFKALEILEKRKGCQQALISPFLTLSHLKSITNTEFFRICFRGIRFRNDCPEIHFNFFPF